MNKERLQQLIEFIPSIPDELFDMKEYRNNYHNVEHKCNTVGCIVGHATALDTPENLAKYIITKTHYSSVKPLVNIDFQEWFLDFFDTSRWNRGAAFIVSSFWVNYDNSKKGAIARIQWILDGKIVPLDWQKKAENGDLFYLPKTQV